MKHTNATQPSIAYNPATDLPFSMGVPVFKGTTRAGVDVGFKDVWH